MDSSSDDARGKLAAWLESTLRSAAAVLARADALLIGAGAGMGVDSGLPDFRGNQGFPGGGNFRPF